MKESSDGPTIMDPNANLAERIDRILIDLLLDTEELDLATAKAGFARRKARVALLELYNLTNGAGAYFSGHR